MSQSRLEHIEAGIAHFYAAFRISAERVDEIRSGVRAKLASQQTQAQRGAGDQT